MGTIATAPGSRSVNIVSPVILLNTLKRATNAQPVTRWFRDTAAKLERLLFQRLLVLLTSLITMTKRGGRPVRSIPFHTLSRLEPQRPASPLIRERYRSQLTRSHPADARAVPEIVDKEALFSTRPTRFEPDLTIRIEPK